MKQKIIIWIVAIAIAVVGFPFYWQYSHSPSNRIESMFDTVALSGLDTSGKATDLAFAYHCTSKTDAAHVMFGLGGIILQNIGAQEWSYDILDISKTGDEAKVRVKIYADANKEKSVVAVFSLKKSEGLLGDWKVHSVAKEGANDTAE